MILTALSVVLTCWPPALRHTVSQSQHIGMRMCEREREGGERGRQRESQRERKERVKEMTRVNSGEGIGVTKKEKQIKQEVQPPPSI